MCRNGHRRDNPRTELFCDLYFVTCTNVTVCARLQVGSTGGLQVCKRHIAERAAISQPAPPWVFLREPCCGLFSQVISKLGALS